MNARATGRWRTILPLLALAVLGFVLRMVCADQGHNFDVSSYRIVADIMARGGDVYAETSRYNYGPIWFYILHGLDLLPWGAGDATTTLRWKVAIFLSCIDIAILVLLTRRYSLKVGALFYFNPISIFITGYHSQFDNVAVLLALIAVLLYSRKPADKPGYAALTTLGLSLIVKHIFFLFPLWLAFKAPPRHRLVTLVLPCLVFAAGFLPFVTTSWDGILHNVFLYKSHNNAPLWSALLPDATLNAIPPIVPFLCTLAALGYVFRHRSAEHGLLLYSIALIAFSSAVANQYLAICIPAIAVLWNRAFFLYTVAGTLFLLVDFAGLNSERVQEWLQWDGQHGYQLLAVLLIYGLYLTVRQQTVPAASTQLR